MQLEILLWVVARCKVELSDNARDVFADDIFTRMPEMSVTELFSTTTALMCLGNRLDPGLLRLFMRRALRRASATLFRQSFVHDSLTISDGSEGGSREGVSSTDHSGTSAVDLSQGIVSLLAAAVNSPR